MDPHDYIILAIITVAAITMILSAGHRQLRNQLYDIEHRLTDIDRVLRALLRERHTPSS